MREAHVIPEADAIDHDTFGECVCGPTVLPTVQDGRIVGRTIRHHALVRTTQEAEQ